MHTLGIPFPFPPWLLRAMELRIDVGHRSSDIERELDALYARLTRPGDALHGLPALCIRLPGLVLRYREADGEHYVYAEDTAKRRLAGYVVFNRLVEVNRRTDPYLRAPHAKFSAAYQRLGIATAVYRWWLDAGNCLISGARQSPGANALWSSLARRYESFYVDLRNKQLRHLGPQPDARTQQDLHTRIVLLGRGWRRERLAECTGMRMEPCVPAPASGAVKAGGCLQ